MWINITFISFSKFVKLIFHLEHIPTFEIKRCSLKYQSVWILTILQLLYAYIY